MKRSMTLLIAAAALMSAPLAASADDAFNAKAYDACVMHLSHHLHADEGQTLGFAPASDVIAAAEDEVLIAFSYGAITGVVYAEPNPNTFVDKPVGSCSAVPGTEAFTRIVVDGEIVSHGTVPFGMEHEHGEHHGHH